jgi:hypothetical protein
MDVHPQLTREIYDIFLSFYPTHTKIAKVERTPRKFPLIGECVLDHVKTKRMGCYITPLHQHQEMCN